MSDSNDSSRIAQILAIITIVIGAVFMISGVGAWFAVSSQLADENITVSDDAGRFAGEPVDGPFTAYEQANVINKHALEATGGKTYAELDSDDPLRQTAMTASFLRASLFTSVVAFGLAAMAFGVGLALALLGSALVMMRRGRAESA
jgi:ABC-type sugar transport system permease subunit